MKTTSSATSPRCAADSRSAADAEPLGVPALFALMRRQHGVASVRQARAAGVSRSVQRRLLGEGAVLEPLPGVLAVGGAPPTFAAQAMAASLLPGVLAVSHGAAARLHRLAGFGEHDHIDVVGERGSHLHPPRPIVGHYSRGPLQDDVVHIGAIPVTSLALTLVLIAAAAPEQRTAQALDDALGRGLPVARIRLLTTQWRRQGRSGAPQLLALLPAP
ncbi:hypothetical protein BH24ACT5_BH24ACT5_18000 [soil metagenome]